MSDQYNGFSVSRTEDLIERDLGLAQRKLSAGRR